MFKIETKYKTPVVGKYARGVYVCPHCKNDMLRTYFNCATGFASAQIGLVMIVECDKCFEKYYSHTCESNYEVFKDTVKAKLNKFYI